ncbi:MAG TPA: GAF domain-containing protein, partial [Urbifossiella sp.]|nr:GAF domain-containing protein [Urbifossiella sp.]
MAHFEYTSVGAPFLQRLDDLIFRGESVVLLGPRHIGKRYVFRLLRDRLTAVGVRVGIVRFLQRKADEGPNPNDEDIDLNAPGVDTLEPTVAAVLKWADDRAAAADGPVVFLAANIDALAHEEAREFLGGVRERTERKALVAVLTGEFDLRDLVHGAKSEFNCAHQFVLRGFDEAEFAAFAGRYIDALGLDFREPVADVYRALYARTGGNPYFLRLELWTRFDMWAAQGGPDALVCSVNEWPRKPTAALLPINAHFKYIMRTIGHNPEVWPTLGRLIAGDPVRVRHNAPDLLELAGIAVRDGDGVLRLPGELMRELVTTYYSPRRFGDMYAGRGEWELAFEHYRRAAARPPANRVRPVTMDDVPDVDHVIKALSTSLYHEAVAGSDAVKRRFVDGCLYVLGYSAVTFWAGGPHWRVGKLHSFGGADPADPPDDAKVLPRGGRLDPGVLTLLPEQENCLAAAILPTATRAEHEAVVVGRPHERTNLSKARKALTRELLGHFIAAYEHACRTERDRERLRVREKYTDIVTDILADLGTKVRDVGLTLNRAGAGLRELGYRRVMFSLVDPTEKWIAGVVEVSDDPNQWVRRQTRYRLSHPIRDVQQDVVLNARRKLVPDTEAEPLTNKELTREVGMRGMAVVPLLNPLGGVIGTLHVERTDGVAPTDEEADDLERFGRHLAVAVEQSSRVNLLESALDQQPEPISILDRLGRIRYANRPAVDMYNAALDGRPLAAGWHAAEDARRITEWLTSDAPGDAFKKFKPATRSALMGGTREVAHLRITAGPTYRVEFLAVGIKDFRDEQVGVLCHVKIFTHLYRVFDALRRLQKANDTQEVIDGTMEATQALGHARGRLYQIDDDNPLLLRSRRLYGSAAAAFREKFDAGKVVLLERAHPSARYAWQCFEYKKPLVFCHDTGKAHGATLRTSRGLECINVLNEQCPPGVEKADGEYWIDVPLMDGKTPLAKLTLSCG